MPSFGAQIRGSDFTKEERERIELWHELSRTDFYVFARFILNRDLLVPRIHGSLCRHIVKPVLEYCHESLIPAGVYGVDWDGERRNDEVHVTRKASSSRRQLILLPRGSYKTTLLLECLPLWILTKRPSASIVIAAQDEDYASRSMRAIDDHVCGNKVFRYLYGEWEKGSPKWGKLEKVISTRGVIGSKEPSLWVATPQTWKPGPHPDYAILDDLVSEKTMDSDDLTARVRGFYDSIQPAMGSPGIIWVDGTRYGELDLYAELMSERFARFFDLYIRSAVLPDGALWWPERIDENFLAARQAEMSPYLYYSQYHQKVVPRSERGFNLEHIKFYPAGDHPAGMRVVAAIDPADARSEGRSSWAMVIAGVDSESNFWDLAAEKGPMTAANATDEFIKMMRQWKPEVVIAEKTGFSKNYIDATLSKAIYEAGLHIPIVEVSPRGVAKRARIMDIQNGFGAIVANRRFNMRRENDAGKSELRLFPGDSSFDWLDIWAYVVRWCNENRFFPRLKTEEEKDNRELEIRQWYQQCDKALAERDRLATARPRKTYVRPGVFTRRAM